MPTSLHYENESLRVKIGGLDKEDFAHALNIVRSIPGRSWHPEDKTWRFPADYMTAQKLMNMLLPLPTPEALTWLGHSKAEMAEAVRTKLPGDAALKVRFADALYPFQRSGVDFMARRPHAILADDMGTGKTIQSISTVYEAHDRDLVRKGSVLIVCPNTLGGNWTEELVKWTDIARDSHNQPVFINGSNRPARLKQLAQGHREGWCIVNWEKLRILPEIAEYEWSAIIADEAHRAKNKDAKQSLALHALKAPIQLAVSGTPIMNSPDELWSLLYWLYPETYTSYWRFYQEYCEYIDVRFGNKKGRVVTGVRNVDALRFELADKLIRRTKREVLPDLPAKLPPQVIKVDMLPKQKALYQEVERELWVQIEQDVKEGKLDKAILQNPELLLRLPNAAARTTRLRQVASTPALLGAKDESAKLDAIVEYIVDSDESSKHVVFCEFTGTCDILVERLRKKKIEGAAYHGKVKPEAREGLKHAFQNEPDPRVLVATPDTGGVGLTLTAANTAHHCEEKWVPALNTQADDRLHRIGQTREVHVIIWRARNSVDTKRVAPTLLRKDRIVGSVLPQDQEVAK